MRRFIAVFSLVVVAVLFSKIFTGQRNPNSKESNSPQDLPQYYVLAPTNGILRHYLVKEGEHVDAHASIALISESAYEQRVRNARQAVAQARLIFEEARLESISSSRHNRSRANTGTEERMRAERDKQAIQGLEREIHELGIAVITAQAKLGSLEHQPFGNSAAPNIIKASETDLQNLQDKLEMATVRLEELRERMKERSVSTKGATTVPPVFNEADRQIGSAREHLQQEEAVLEAILKEAPKFTTIIASPFHGQVLQLLLPEGGFIRPGQPAITLTQLP